MTVNNIPLAIGQKWKTRGGDEVEIVDYGGHSVYLWDLSNKVSVTNQGQVWRFRKDYNDLITLIQDDQHGFIPWNGGECPVDDGVTVEVKFRDGATAEYFGGNFDWRSTGHGWNIIAYRVVEQEVKPTMVDVEENKEIIKMNQKYTVKDVLYALDNLTDEYVDITLEEQIEEYLAVRESADYKLYLELKSRFESNE